MKLKAPKYLKPEGFGGLLEEWERGTVSCLGDWVEYEGKSGYVDEDGGTSLARCIW